MKTTSQLSLRMMTKNKAQTPTVAYSGSNLVVMIDRTYRVRPHRIFAVR